MANILYFADLEGGKTLSFTRVDHRGKEGAFGYDHESRQWIKTNRTVEYKAFASKHECDARCMNAMGRVMKCECACGGKNHGKGRFNCEAA